MNKEKMNTTDYNDTEKFTRLERLKSDQLHADLPFQKNYNNEIVDLIDYTFDESVLQALDASFRDGKYNVIDGKHRLSGIRRYEERTGNKVRIPVLVRYGLTEAEECELFEKITKQRRKIKPMELLESAYSRGNEFTVGFVDTIREVGFLFDFTDSCRNGYIHLTRTPIAIYKDLGTEGFKEFLTLFYKTWNGDKKYMKEVFLKGLYDFYVNFKDEIDPNLFVKRLSLLDDFSVNSKGGKQIKDIAALIFNKYNRNKKMYKSDLLGEKKYFFMN